MSDAVVANRYAVALFQLGQEKSMLDKLEEDVRAVQNVFEQDEKLMSFLKHPKVSLDQKKQLLGEVFQGASKELVNTVRIMIDRHREDAILPMTKLFIQMTNEAQKIAEAAVYSVRELSDSEKESIQKVFTKKLNVDTLRIHNIIDSSILGGVKLKIGNRIYDGSVKGKLERFERNLVSANK